jgi:CheY-like chemotaxis protein
LTDGKAHRLSVFLVEDEAIIRMMIAGMVDELGHDVVVEAGNIPDALKLATTADVGIAILDINVGGQNIAPVADILSRRRIPFVFASGYGAAGLPEQYRDRTVLQKPFLVQQLADAITVALL